MYFMQFPEMASEKLYYDFFKTIAKNYVFLSHCYYSNYTILLIFNLEAIAISFWKYYEM
jgi:hypothetical protein